MGFSHLCNSNLDLHQSMCWSSSLASKTFASGSSLAWLDRTVPLSPFLDETPPLSLSAQQVLTLACLPLVVGTRSRKPSKLHSSPMTQQRKLELLSLHSTKTSRSPQDLTNTSPPSSSSQSAQESLTTTLYWNGSSKDSTHKSWYNSLSWEQSRPPPLWRNFTQKPLRSREIITTLHHSGEDLSHPMEEVVITMTPMLWTWIASHYPLSSKLATCAKITASYAIRKAVLLGIILVIIGIAQQVFGTTTQNHSRLPMPGSSSPLSIWPLPPVKMIPWIPSSRMSPRLKDMIRYFIPWDLPLICPWMDRETPCQQTTRCWRMGWIH